MTGVIFEGLEKALVKKETDRFRNHLRRVVNEACALFDTPSFEEPLGFAGLEEAKKALFAAAEPAIHNKAQMIVFQKLLLTFEEVVNDGTE